MRTSEETGGTATAHESGGRRGSRGVFGSDSGFVTAEAAVVTPALVLLMAMLVWGVMAGAAYIQCVDGARAGARAVARGEPGDGVRAAVRSTAPRGTRVTTEREGELVRVRVRADTPGLGPLTVGLRAEAVALAEEYVGVGGRGLEQ